MALSRVERRAGSSPVQTRVRSDAALSPSAQVAPVTSDGAADAGETGENAPDSLAAALSLRRNAAVGLVVGLGLAALLYVPRLPVLDVGTTGSAGFYLGLAVVLAATTAAVVTAGLSAKVMLEPVLDRRAWLRRGGSTAIVGGVLWALLPAIAWLATVGRLPVGLWRTATGVAAVALVVGTAGLHAAVRDGTGPERRQAAGPGGDGRRIRRVEGACYWVVVLALLLAAGNASGDAGPVVETARGPLATPFLTASALGFAVTVPFSASGDLLRATPADAGRGADVEPLATRALQIGALVGTLGVAWLLPLGGWTWLAGVVGTAGATAAGLAVATVPTGIGWAVAGRELRSAATRDVDRRNPSR